MTTRLIDQMHLGWPWKKPGRVRIGYYEHKELFCRTLLDTFDPYKAAIIAWLEPGGAGLARLNRRAGRRNGLPR